MKKRKSVKRIKRHHILLISNSLQAIVTKAVYERSDGTHYMNGRYPRKRLTVEKVKPYYVNGYLIEFILDHRD